MLRTREVLLVPGGIPPLDPTPRPRGSSLGLEGFVLRGRSPRCPLFLLVRSNQKPPTPLLYYLSEGEKKFA